jgi:HK97 family phage prohead protease
MKTECRIFSIRASQGDEGVLMGRCLAYGRISKPLGSFREIIHPDAFKKSLADPKTDCMFRYNHAALLGRQSNGTLQLANRADGLHFRVQLNMDTTIGRDVYALVKRQDVQENSFAFMTQRDSWHDNIRDAVADWAVKPSDVSDEDNLPVRCLREATISDASVVDDPAYGNGATFVNARTLFPNGVGHNFPAEVRRRIEAASVVDAGTIERLARASAALRDAVLALDPSHRVNPDDVRINRLLVEAHRKRLGLE